MKSVQCSPLLPGQPKRLLLYPEVLWQPMEVSSGTDLTHSMSGLLVLPCAPSEGAGNSVLSHPSSSPCPMLPHPECFSLTWGPHHIMELVLTSGQHSCGAKSVLVLTWHKVLCASTCVWHAALGRLIVLKSSGLGSASVETEESAESSVYIHTAFDSLAQNMKQKKNRDSGWPGTKTKKSGLSPGKCKHLDLIFCLLHYMSIMPQSLDVLCFLILSFACH